MEQKQCKEANLEIFQVHLVTFKLNMTSQSLCLLAFTSGLSTYRIYVQELEFSDTWKSRSRRKVGKYAVVAITFIILLFSSTNSITADGSALFVLGRRSRRNRISKRNKVQNFRVDGNSEVRVLVPGYQEFFIWAIMRPHIGTRKIILCAFVQPPRSKLNGKMLCYLISFLHILRSPSQTFSPTIQSQN